MDNFDFSKIKKSSDTNLSNIFKKSLNEDLKDFLRMAISDADLEKFFSNPSKIKNPQYDPQYDGNLMTSIRYRILFDLSYGIEKHLTNTVEKYRRIYDYFKKSISFEFFDNYTLIYHDFPLYYRERLMLYFLLLSLSKDLKSITLRYENLKELVIAFTDMSNIFRRFAPDIYAKIFPIDLPDGLYIETYERFDFLSNFEVNFLKKMVGLDLRHEKSLIDNQDFYICNSKGSLFKIDKIYFNEVQLNYLIED